MHVPICLAFGCGHLLANDPDATLRFHVARSELVVAGEATGGNIANGSELQQM